MRPLPITGLGVICATGQGTQALAALVREGRSALGHRSRVPTSLIDPGWTGSVPESLDVEFDELPGGEVQRFFVDWAIAAGSEALEQARVRERFAAERVALVVGSNLEDFPLPLWQLLDEVARALAIAGPQLLVSMACASSLTALAVARVLLENGDADAVLVGGSDVLTPRVAGGFRRLDLLGEQPCSPFSASEGTALGEGAGLIVVEAIDPPSGVTAIAWLLGEGSAADAFHETSPEPRGRGTELALARALRQAGLGPSEIDLVMVHGTGTLANDAAEARALRRMLGAELERIAVGAGKSLVGHAQGAAGAIELIAALLGIASGMLPALTHFVAPARPEAPPRLLIDDATRRARVERFVVEGAGFGGAHAAAIVGRPTTAHAPPPRRRPTLCGWASLGAGPDGRVELDPRRAVRGVDLRGCDPSTRLLTVVVDTALTQARVPRSARREVGLFVAQRGSSIAAVARLRSEIERWGMTRASAAAFVDSLAIMPAGACTRALELWGPMQLICGDALAGLAALIGACEAFARDPTVPFAVAAAVAEQDPSQPEHSREGASAIVLGEGGSPTVLGWAITGPGGDAIGLASSRAGVGTIERVIRIATLEDLARDLESEAGTLALVAEGLGGSAALILATDR
jgi:3-oxoacyl-[acyl-carrier-protein] synthase II